MGDVERRKSGPDEPEAAARERQSVTYQLDWMTYRLREFSSLFKKFEEVAKTRGYVSPRILRERRRRRKRMLIKESADFLVEAGQLVTHLLRSRDKARLSTSSTSEGEGARENRG